MVDETRIQEHLPHGNEHLDSMPNEQLTVGYKMNFVATTCQFKTQFCSDNPLPQRWDNKLLQFSCMYFIESNLANRNVFWKNFVKMITITIIIEDCRSKLLHNCVLNYLLNIFPIFAFDNIFPLFPEGSC
jgi:hypothetical protein